MLFSDDDVLDAPERLDATVLEHRDVLAHEVARRHEPREERRQDTELDHRIVSSRRP